MQILNSTNYYEWYECTINVIVYIPITVNLVQITYNSYSYIDPVQTQIIMCNYNYETVGTIYTLEYSWNITYYG
jgi:hypothetical protein